MEVGLAKLEEASVSVELLKKSLAVMEEELADASQKAETVFSAHQTYNLNSTVIKIINLLVFKGFERSDRKSKTSGIS